MNRDKGHALSSLLLGPFGLVWKLLIFLIFIYSPVSLTLSESAKNRIH